MSDRKPITAFLGQEMIFFDGGMGTMLQSAGLKAGELPELLNLRQPEIITDIHRQYYDAGCHVVTTNTFGANRGKMEAAGYSVEEIVTAAVNCAVSGCMPDY